MKKNKYNYISMSLDSETSCLFEVWALENNMVKAQALRGLVKMLLEDKSLQAKLLGLDREAFYNKKRRTK